MPTKIKNAASKLSIRNRPVTQPAEFTVNESELRELQVIFQQINQAGQETLQRINGIHENLQDILQEVRTAAR